MAGNSFETHDGSHVTGFVAMAIDESGKAVPLVERGPTLEQFCRALTYHAALVSKMSGEQNAVAAAMIAFARSDPAPEATGDDHA